MTAISFKTDPIRLVRIGESDGVLIRLPQNITDPSSLPGLVNEMAAREI
jgi:hypothetical protein